VSGEKGAKGGSMGIWRTLFLSIVYRSCEVEIYSREIVFPTSRHNRLAEH
jgi:hypothetical protein